MLNLEWEKDIFFSTMSEKEPRVNFIGIDRYGELIARSYQKAQLLQQSTAQKSLPNVKLVRANIEYIDQIFTADEIERLYIHFTDSWPKKKHAQHRGTHPHFIEKYDKVLNDKGEIHFKTDSERLVTFSFHSFAELGLQMRNISLHLHRTGYNEQYVRTEYEEKFIGQGMPIYRVEVWIWKASV